MIENVCEIQIKRMDERVEIKISTFSEYVQNIVFDKLDEAGFAYHIVGDVIVLSCSHSLLCRLMLLIVDLTWDCVVVLC